MIKFQFSLFLLESLSHRGLRGYGTYCHIRNAKDAFKNIDEWREMISKKEVNVKLHDKEDVYTLSELKEKLCMNYFKTYFENVAKEGPVLLPQVQGGINKITNTMIHWCNNTNDSRNLKGLVIHSFSVPDYLRKFFYDELEIDKLRADLDIKEFPTTPIIIVYNPSENVILLIRISEKARLREQIEFCSHDMKMFILLFGNEIKRNGVKVISLLASNEAPNRNLKCDDCQNCIVSLETLESDELFEKWFHNHAAVFNADIDDIVEANIIKASANIIGCIAAAPYFDDLPTFTNAQNEQMKHLLVLLTPAQQSVLYSGNNHMVVQGPYGSGKSVVARKKLQMLLDDFKTSKKSEEVHFICHDPKSALLKEIETVPNMKTHGNEEGQKLSEIATNILKDANSENVNLIVDEYNGESLDKEEAESLNRIFEENFQNSVVFLLPQSMEKERNSSIHEKSAKEEKNKFDLLHNFNQVQLNLVMRNSIEINNLIRVTQNFLKEQETMFQHPREENASKASTKPRHLREENTSKALTKRNKSFGFLKRLVSPPSTSKAKEALVAEVAEVTEEVTEDTREKISPGDEPSSDLKIQDRAVGSIGLDEAFGFAEIPRASKDDSNIIVNRFRYIPSKGIGHNVKSQCPKLFEMDYANTEKQSFENFCALTRTFKDLKIKNSTSNNKHVILHFDTSNSKTPILLASVIEYLKIGPKVTNDYRDFNYDESKSILVCNFRLFRGLEHSNVTIIIDQDIYNLQHYLVETMARCTTKLNIVVMEKSSTILNIMAQWGKELDGQPLLEHWKVQFNKGSRETVHQKDEKLNILIIENSLLNDEVARKIFGRHAKESRASNVLPIAREYIKNR